MKITLRETIIRVEVGSCNVRFWCDADLNDGNRLAFDAERLKLLVNSLEPGYAFVPEVGIDWYITFAKRLLMEPSVSAVEVTDKHGCGNVLYKDWP